MTILDQIAADPLPYLYIAAYYTAIVFALRAGLAAFKRSLDARIIADQRRAEGWRVGTTWRLQYTYRRTDPGPRLRASMLKLRRAR